MIEQGDGRQKLNKKKNTYLKQPCAACGIYVSLFEA